MKTPVLRNPEGITETAARGEIPTMIEGHSHTSGVLLHKRQDGRSECGIWICTPDYWDCHVSRDAFCHFLQERATCTRHDGEVIEITPAAHRGLLRGGLTRHLSGP